MKNIIYNALQVIVLLSIVFLGSIPFLISIIIGIVLSQRWLVYTVALFLTLGITLLSFWHPEIFRFGPVELKIHDGLFIAGFHTLATNMVKNLVFAALGAWIGCAAREGYQDTKNHSEHNA